MAKRGEGRYGLAYTGRRVSSLVLWGGSEEPETVEVSQDVVNRRGEGVWEGEGAGEEAGWEGGGEGAGGKGGEGAGEGEGGGKAEEKAREKAREEDEGKAGKKKAKKRKKVKMKSESKKGRSGGRVLEGVELVNHVEGEGGRQRVYQTRPGSLRVSLPRLSQFEQGGLLFGVDVACQEPLDIFLGGHNHQHLGRVILERALAHHERLVPVVRFARAAWVGLKEAAPTGLVQPASTHAVFFRPCKRNYGHGGKNNQLVKP